MPIICFEGASAVGKTTLSAYLRENHSACVIPEVNLLFERKADEPKFRYFERQIERWQIAVRTAKTHEMVILDGDPFQPLWYNWAYDFDFGDPFEKILSFYRNAVAAGVIDFPDKYFILSADLSVLQKRKANDSFRSRKNFERHLRFIEPQIAFFKFLKNLDENFVELIENREISESVRKVLNSVRIPRSGNPSPLDLFEAAGNWLGKHKPEEFIFQP